MIRNIQWRCRRGAVSGRGRWWRDKEWGRQIIGRGKWVHGCGRGDRSSPQLQRNFVRSSVQPRIETSDGHGRMVGLVIRKLQRTIRRMDGIT